MNVVETPVAVEAVVEVAVVPEPMFEVEMVPTSEFIKNIEVTFEIVSPILEQEFYITTAEVKEIEVSEPEFVSL